MLQHFYYPVRILARSLRLTLESRVDHFAEAKGYRVVEPLRWGRVYKLHQGGSYFLLKFVGANGLIAHRDVLPALRGPFRRLVVPQVVELGTCPKFGPWVIVDWHEGRDFSREWDESHPELAGGRAITEEVASLLLELVEDLRGVDGSAFASTGIERRTAEWLEDRLRGQLSTARAEGLLTEAQEGKAWSVLTPLLECVHGGPLGISNHDFQVRNLIQLPDGRVKLIDWDAARISTFETEHCVAYQWMLMWNRPEWQRGFIDQARARLHLSKVRLWAALLVNTLNQAMSVYAPHPQLRSMLLDAFLNLLREEYYEYVWGGVGAAFPAPFGSGELPGRAPRGAATPAI